MNGQLKNFMINVMERLIIYFQEQEQEELLVEWQKN